ncbi:MAG: glycosyltransferase family 2 protein [Parachlamydiales bacterium]|jgi:hypothetical protein
MSARSGTNNIPVLSIVIISFNTSNILYQCLKRVASEIEDLSAEVILVDNASTDDSADMVKNEFPQFTLILSPINLGFAAANNLAFQHATGTYVVLINSDLLLHNGVLKEALKRMERERGVAAGGIQLMSGEGRPQISSRFFPTPWRDLVQRIGLFKNHSYEQCPYPDWVPGAFVIIRRNLLMACAGFDERFFMYFEEVDLCRTLKEQYGTIRYWQDLTSIHLGSASLQAIEGKHITAARQVGLWRFQSTYLYYRKHYGRLGAWSSYLLENGWQYLRLLKNWTNKLKYEETILLLNLYKDAWKSTHRGKISPEIPW